LLTEDLAAIRTENRALRAKFVATHPCMEATEGQADWLKSKAIFAVTHKGRQLVPAFQFDGQGRPRPIVGELLNLLPSRLSGWQLAFWFVSSNSWLGGTAPYEVLDDALRVTAAARSEAEEIMG